MRIHDDDYARHGRVRQKQRTRAALVAAAQELMNGTGVEPAAHAPARAPTVASVAERAGVSQATAYRYFPTQEALLAEAAVEPLVSSLERAAKEAEARTDPLAALDHFLGVLLDELSRGEATLRVLHARSLEAAGAAADDALGDAPAGPADGAPAGPAPGPRHRRPAGSPAGDRRPDWFRRVLAPLRPELGGRGFERLVCAVTAAAGVEALSTLRDACGLSPAQAREVMRWSALSLVRAAMGREHYASIGITGRRS